MTVDITNVNQRMAFGRVDSVEGGGNFQASLHDQCTGRCTKVQQEISSQQQR